MMQALQAKLTHLQTERNELSLEVARLQEDKLPVNAGVEARLSGKENLPVA